MYFMVLNNDKPLDLDSKQCQVEEGYGVRNKDWTRGNIRTVVDDHYYLSGGRM